MSMPQGREAAASPGPDAPSAPVSPREPAAPARVTGNAIRFGPRTRRLIRAVARMVNPLVLRIAGRRHMPVLGIVHHRGRKSGRGGARCPARACAGGRRSAAPAG